MIVFFIAWLWMSIITTEKNKRFYHFNTKIKEIKNFGEDEFVSDFAKKYILNFDEVEEINPELNGMEFLHDNENDTVHVTHHYFHYPAEMWVIIFLMAILVIIVILVIRCCKKRKFILLRDNANPLLTYYYN